MKRILSTLKEKWPEYLIESAVIVGSILGAIVLENWNEDRQIEDRTRILLERVAKNIEDDLRSIEPIITYYDRVDSLTLFVLDNNLTVDDYLKPENKSLAYLVYESKGFDPNDAAFQALSNKLENVPAEFDGLINELNVLYLKVLSEVKYFYQICNEQSADRLFRHQENFTWFSQLMEGTSPDAAAYFAYDPIYKNELALNRTMWVLNYGAYLLKYKYQSLICLYSLSKMLETEFDMLKIPESMPLPARSEMEKYEGQFHINLTPYKVTFEEILILEGGNIPIRWPFYMIETDSFKIMDGSDLLIVRRDESASITGYDWIFDSDTLRLERN